jgi:hypothetical protein
LDAFLFPAFFTTTGATVPAPPKKRSSCGCAIGGGKETGGGGYLITGGEMGLESSSSLSSKAIFLVLTYFLATMGLAIKASLLKPVET